MKEIKKILIRSSAGLVIGCSGMVTGQAVLVSTGVSLAALGITLGKQEELAQKVADLQEDIAQNKLNNTEKQPEELAQKVVTLEDTIAQNQQNHTESIDAINSKLDQITVNTTKQSNTQKIRQKLLLSALDELRKDKRILANSIFIHEKQLAQLNQKTANSAQNIIIPVSKTVVPSRSKRVFIDGNNLNHAANKSGLDIDFERFTTTLSEIGDQSIQEVTFNYYTGECANNNYRQKTIISELNKLEYTVRVLPVIYKDDQSMKTCGDDIAIATDMMKYVNRGDQVILVTGDGDFVPVIEEIQQRGAQVIVVSNSQMINHKLKAIADKFVTLESLKSKISKINSLQPV